MRGKLLLAAMCAAALLAVEMPAASAQRAAFVAPPRTISDITAFLDQQKPDPAKRAKAEAEADAQPPGQADRAKLKDFHFRRAQARASLGRLADAIADSELAITNSADYVNEGSRIEQYQEVLLRMSGDYRSAVALLERMGKKLNVTSANKGRGFVINLRLATNLLFLGEINRAEAYVKRNEALLAEARSWPNAQIYFSGFEAAVEEGRGRLATARGRHAEAETAYARAEARYRDTLTKSRSWPIPPPQGNLESAIDYMAAFASRAKAWQGRHAEAENDIRRALLSRLTLVGKHHVDTANMLYLFAELLSEQSRLKEAEALARASLEIFDAIRFRHDTNSYAMALNKLAAALFAQKRYEETKQIYAALDEAIKNWPPERIGAYRWTWTRIYVHYYTGEVGKGIEAARGAYEHYRARRGENHYETALTRAMLASGLAFARRDAEALPEFAAAIPVLMSASGDADDEDPTVTAYADRRLQVLIEAYIALLARTTSVANRAEESLRLADIIRGRSVQNALAASAVRAAARTPELADLARKEQDLRKQILAQAALLNNALAETTGQAQAAGLKELQQELERLRKDRREARRQIERRFPDYAGIASPAPATAEEIRAALKPEEALLSFYFGYWSSFVWVIPKTGPVAFVQLRMTAPQLEQKVKVLRASLDPNVETIDDIPAFDMAAAHDLYKELLGPVERAWREAKTLLVVTNGALGLLPLGLLPTQPVKSAAKRDAQPYFAAYREAAWLARTHATVALPSASALRTLRRMPAPPAKREQIIGFGDPIFSKEQAKEQAAGQTVAANDTRGRKFRLRASPPRGDNVRGADLGLLPRLPDTADELKAVAAALQADPLKVLHLGRDANERVVKSLDLARYKIVAFSTHGLVPGDLEGLTQPALALTAPDVADTDGDGLLTVEEILGLKLNADWVVLSACNTAAGAGAGAEAVSGLGRAFFYAGSRALLVTNWSVHSASARELVTDLFRRQTDNPGLSRAEALRRATVALLDSGEAKDEAGKTVFTYGHPLFWAPYTIVGDGG